MHPHRILILGHLFILDGKVIARGGLVLVADEIRDLLVLGLLEGALVALVAAAEALLDKVDTYVGLSVNQAVCLLS